MSTLAIASLVYIALSVVIIGTMKAVTRKSKKLDGMMEVGVINEN